MSTSWFEINLTKELKQDFEYKLNRLLFFWNEM